MDNTLNLAQQQLRRVIEARLNRCLTDQEFELLLDMGNGLFWDCQDGAIRPYDLATLHSGKQLLEHRGNAQW
jgi:hypothetical protein